MSTEPECIDLTGDTPIISRVDKQAVPKEEYINLASDSSASIDFEWDIIRKRALKSLKDNNNQHFHLSYSDSFDSCDGFIEKGSKTRREFGQIRF